VFRALLLNSSLNALIYKSLISLIFLKIVLISYLGLLLN